MAKTPGCGGAKGQGGGGWWAVITDRKEHEEKSRCGGEGQGKQEGKAEMSGAPAASGVGCLQQ